MTTVYIYNYRLLKTSRPVERDQHNVHVKKKGGIAALLCRRDFAFIEGTKLCSLVHELDSNKKKKTPRMIHEICLDFLFT
jgi:hypothetical protein